MGRSFPLFLCPKKKSGWIYVQGRTAVFSSLSSYLRCPWKELEKHNISKIKRISEPYTCMIYGMYFYFTNCIDNCKTTLLFPHLISVPPYTEKIEFILEQDLQNSHFFSSLNRAKLLLVTIVKISRHLFTEKKDSLISKYFLH